MPVFQRIPVGFWIATLVSTASAAPGEATYKTRCALCHDSGATQAPRVGHPADWLRRIDKGRSGLLRSAIQGVPDTAMLPRAGFPEMRDDEIAAAVDYMLGTLGLAIPIGPAETVARPSQAVSARVDDATLVADVAKALRAHVLPRAAVEGARVGGITIEARQGRVELRGMVDSAQIIRAAEQTVRDVPGVVAVENRLIGAELFEHD